VVLAEGSDAGAAWITPTLKADQAAKRSALASAFAKLQQSGVPNVHYVKGTRAQLVLGRSERCWLRFFLSFRGFGCCNICSRSSARPSILLIRIGIGSGQGAIAHFIA